MPQPLSTFPDDTPFKVDSRAGTPEGRLSQFLHNPEIAVLAMEVIAKWSQVDLRLVELYNGLAGGTRTDAFHIYSSLTGAGPKAAALLKLAERKIPPEYLDVFAAIRRFSKTCEGNRNIVAHHVWGYIRGRPDLALLTDPVALVVDREGGWNKKKMMVWSKQDFINAATQIVCLHDCYSTASELTHASLGAPAAVWLRRQPEIQSRLKPLAPEIDDTPPKEDA